MATTDATDSTEGDVQDVSLEEGLSGEGTEHVDDPGIDQPRPAPPSASPAPEPTESEKAEAEAANAQAKADLELLAPKAAARQWVIGQGTETARAYIQRELSVVGKAQWFGLLGEVLEKALSGESALSLNSLLSPPQTRAGQLRAQDFQDADTFVHAVGKLLVYAPDFMQDSVCIWLDVPDYEHELVKAMMRQSPEIGGMSDEMFEEIVSTFIDQNYKSINAFFRERFPRLRARWQARAAEGNRSGS